MTITFGDKPDSAHVPMPVLLRVFWVWSAVVFGLTVVLAWVEFHAGLGRGRWDPLGYPHFADLVVYTGTYHWLHTSVFFFNIPAAPISESAYSAVAYPPFCAVVLAWFYAAANPVARYLEVTVTWLGIAIWAVRRRLVLVGISKVTATLFPLTLVLISYPIIRMVNEGNVELSLWIVTAAGCWAYLRDHDDAAAVLWGLAAAMKLYPVILLMLMLPRRRYRAFGLGLATFLCATVLSLWWLGPTIGVAWRGSLQNVFGYQGMRAGEWSLRELVANHSVFELVKLAGMIAGLPLAKLTLPYYACGLALIGFIFYKELWKMPVANQLLAASVFMVMFPTVSYFHTLVQLYAPLLVLMFLAIRAAKAGVSIPGLRLTLILFVPLFAAFTLFTFRAVLMFDGLIQAILLVLLFGCALRYPFALDGEQASAL